LGSDFDKYQLRLATAYSMQKLSAPVSFAQEANSESMPFALLVGLSSANLPFSALFWRFGFLILFLRWPSFLLPASASPYSSRPICSLLPTASGPSQSAAWKTSSSLHSSFTLLGVMACLPSPLD